MLERISAGATISVVVPVFNEQDSIPGLIPRLTAALERLGHEFEIIFVDDGSTDGSMTALRRAADADTRLKIVSFRRNFGQTAAIMAGIDHSRNDVLVFIDADLQNEPDDIPELVHKLDDGWDIVSGWRKERKDPATRTLPSQVANKFRPPDIA